MVSKRLDHLQAISRQTIKLQPPGAERPLLGLNLAITMPPAHYFGGCDLAIAAQHASALRRLGAIVYELDTTPFHARDRGGIERQVKSLDHFQLDAIISSPQAGYAVDGVISLSEKHNSIQHLFLDRLNIPTIFYWDHVLIQTPKYLTPEWPTDSCHSKAGVIRRLQNLFTHPLAYHYFPDTGHIPELLKLGIAAFDQDTWCVPGISDQYFMRESRSATNVARKPEVAFFGNVYIAASRKIEYGDSRLTALRESAMNTLTSNWDCCPYVAYKIAINELDPQVQSQLRLDPDESFYWRFLFDELAVVANGRLRLEKVLACGRPVVFYGGFADPESRMAAHEAGCTLGDTYLPYGAALAVAYNRTEISIDVANAPYLNGFSTKLFSCFAADGFMLTSRKVDINMTLGDDLADAISYSSADELSSKVDRYLTHERERREVAGSIKEIVRRNHTMPTVFANTIPIALERIRSRLS
jgi:Glycosyl transferases group 1